MQYLNKSTGLGNIACRKRSMNKNVQESRLNISWLGGGDIILKNLHVYYNHVTAIVVVETSYNAAGQA